MEDFIIAIDVVEVPITEELIFNGDQVVLDLTNLIDNSLDIEDVELFSDEEIDTDTLDDMYEDNDSFNDGAILDDFDIDDFDI